MWSLIGPFQWSLKFCLPEVHITIYHFRVHNTISVSSSRFMPKVNHSQRNGVGCFHYSSPRWYVSNGLWRGPNRDCMQKLHPHEVDVRTYQFGIHKYVGVPSSSVIFRVHYSIIDGVGPFNYCNPRQGHSNDLSSNPNIDSMQKLLPWNLTYQLTTLRFIKLLAFHILG